MNARHHLGVAFVLVLVLAGCGNSVNVPAAEKPGNQQSLQARRKQLLADRVKSAQMACEATRAAHEADTITLGDVVRAIDALWNAELGVADTASQRIAAHVKRIENLWQLQMKVDVLFEKGDRGGEAEKMARMEYCLADAEIALIDACVADGQPYPVVLAPLQNRPRFDRDRDDDAPAAEAGLDVLLNRSHERLVFVLPNNFRGVFFVTQDDASGAVPVVKDGDIFTYTVPENGLLVVWSLAPFLQLHSTEARYADGQMLYNEEGSQAADTVLRELGGQDGGRDKLRLIIGVGTLDEFHTWQKEYGFSTTR